MSYYLILHGVIMEIRDFVLNNLLSGFSGMSYDQAAEAREALALSLIHI